MERLALLDDGSAEASSEFAFAFNDVNFSDRILQIEILPDSPGSKPDPDVSLADWASNRNRRRDAQLAIGNEHPEQREVRDMNCNLPDLEETANNENQEEETVAMVEESPLDAEVTVHESDHEAGKGNEESSCMDHSSVQVRTLHISSLILAAKSPFFYKLFSNGMKESEQRNVTLRIQASEEAALLDLLNFMYSNTLPRTTSSAILDVLMVADKFEVASCMRYCCRLLRHMPMTSESALLYLDLPSTVLMSDTVQPLMDAARQYLATHFKDLSNYHEEVLSLPLAGIEAVLFSDDLQVTSEDEVFDFLLNWAQAHYPMPDERRRLLSTRLLRFIRFPFMTSHKLKHVLTCSDIEPDMASKLALDALFFKAEPPYRKRALAACDPGPSFRRYIKRAYKYRPIKVLEFEVPYQHCVVYLDLRREECVELFPAGRVYSQAFHLGGQDFFLSGHCNMDQNSSFHCFGLFLWMQEKGSVGFTVDYEFASRIRRTEEFVSKYKGNYTFAEGKAMGYMNLFGVPWTDFVADDSPYFINGVLHLRTQLTIRR